MDPRVDVNAPNKDGETAFMRVASWNRIEALKELLMDLRVDVNATNKDGYTVLMQAARFNKVEQVKMLLANNRVRRDIEYRPGRVAYHLAKNSEIIELLSKGMSWSDKHLVDVIEAAAPAAFMLVGIVIYDKIFPKQS
jgi:ankyrin repeat protein